MLDIIIRDVFGRCDSFKPSSTVAYLSNTLTNLQFVCMALLNLSLFCFVLYCYASVQYCNA